MNTFTDAQLIVSRDVAALLDRVGARRVVDALDAEEREALSTLSRATASSSRDREADRQRARSSSSTTSRDDTDELRVTVLTTLQCNFACDYCFQGDHGDYNKFADKMSLETAARVAEWIEARLDASRPRSFVADVLRRRAAAEPAGRCTTSPSGCGTAAQARGMQMTINIITNGLLLTPEVVDRLLPFGLNGVKITLDGDRDTHNRMRPLRGGQGTFDRIIENIRQVAGRCRDRDRRQLRRELGRQLSGAARVPARAGVRRQARQGQLQADHPRPAGRRPFKPKGFIPLTPVGAEGKPLNGTCMTSAGAAAPSIVRHLPLPRRQDVVPARGDQAPRLPDRRRRAHGPVRDPQAARPHHRPRRLALRVPRVHRRRAVVDRPHRRPAARRGAAMRRSASSG